MRLAVYTTVYPGAERYLSEWSEAVGGQSDRDFDLWIGIDVLDPGEVESSIGNDLRATTVVAPDGATPAEVRGRALAALVDSYDGVVLLDVDDLPGPRRVGAAREGLHEADLYGCAMQLADPAGRPLDIRFGPSDPEEATRVLPSRNAFGFSNTAYRTDWIRRLLPIPGDAVLVDWLWATRLWLEGGRLRFDPTTRMLYRQHPANLAGVLPPFSPQQVALGAQLVCDHYELLDRWCGATAPPGRWREVEQARARAVHFRDAMRDPEIQRRYAAALSDLGPQPFWWSMIAHPRLEMLWNEQ